MTRYSNECPPHRVADESARQPGKRARLAVVACAALVLASCSPAVTNPATGNPGPGTPTPTGVEATAGPTPSLAPSGSPIPPTPIVTPEPTALVPSASNPYPNGVLIADRGNGRLIVLNSAGRIVWQFPVAGSFPRPTPFNADDAFFTPDGKSITANDEGRHVIYRIDVATRKVVWSYGHLGVKGSAPGYLNTPDDAYGLPNGDIVVADINNCRILQIAPDKRIVRQWGKTGVCRTDAPVTYGYPNGDTPLPDGGLLVTQIHGARVERLSATGQVVWDIHVPIVYPSDAQLDSSGNVIVAGFTNPGAVVCVTPGGTLVWRYAPTSGPGRLNHPSLAIPLGNGLVSINDDDRNRLVVLDTRTLKIVWQYGVTDRASAAAGSLSDPDGHEPVPANVILP
ncbi:MAG TPA: PQQ-binding-like beta-propeller repeat protein [Candidatus Limnocylindrales bacterium]|nr:PQQ-binding-like beta-propeller repeat protein [Candidatus Limnocylindrales bacterium]